MMQYEIPFAEGKITLHTILRQGQVNKFSGLAKKIGVAELMYETCGRGNS
jgi:hypothetical protein